MIPRVNRDSRCRRDQWVWRRRLPCRCASNEKGRSDIADIVGSASGERDRRVAVLLAMTALELAMLADTRAQWGTLAWGGVRSLGRVLVMLAFGVAVSMCMLVAAGLRLAVVGGGG
jgi:hypothetical protein